MNYSKFADLETYLFGEVTKKFQKDGFIDSIDFFCIVIWKAERAKSKIWKNKFDRKVGAELNKSIEELTRKIYVAKSDAERMEILANAKFQLPMASAILTVLYPDKFTVYDYRVCETYVDFEKLSMSKKKLPRYFELIEKMKADYPNKTLREIDCELWGKSFFKQLDKNVKNGFLENIPPQ